MGAVLLVFLLGMAYVGGAATESWWGALEFVFLGLVFYAAGCKERQMGKSAMTPGQRAKQLVDQLCNDPEVWLTHGMPGECGAEVLRGVPRA
jgi:hypothetical protein